MHKQILKTSSTLLIVLLMWAGSYGQSPPDKTSLKIFEQSSIADSVWEHYSLDDLVEFQKQYDQETERLLSETDKLRQQGIRDMEAFIKGHPNSRILDKIIIRLAHMHYQQAVQDFGLANEEYNRQLTLYDQGGLEELPKEPLQNYDRPLSLYQQLIEEFPQSPLVDDAMYSKGFLLEDLGRQDEAFKVFDELIAAFPDSKFSPIAYMRMAEYYFNPPVHDIEKAIELYKRVLKYKDSSKYDAALYRLGWAYYKLSDYPSAISYFTILADDIEVAGQIDPNHKYHFPAVRDEAIEYIGISFLDYGGPTMAAQYFNEIGGRAYGFDVLKKIGDAYMDVKEEYENAIKSYQLLLSMYPDSPAAPTIQAKIAEGYRQLEDERMAYVRRAELFKNYKSDTEWWNKTDDLVAKNEANSLAEKALRDNINLLLRSAEETNDPDVYLQAVNDSREYLASFPNDSNAVFIHWNMALTLDTKLKMRDQAYDEYMRISKLYWNTRFQKQAAENAIAIADEAVGADSLEMTPQTALISSEMSPGIASPDSLSQVLNLESEELTADEQRIADALNNYIMLFPDDSETAKILAKAGALYYERHQFKESLKYFKTLIRHFPDSEEANYARYITMESYFGKGDYESTELIARKLKDISPKYAENANKRLSEAIFLQANTFADSLDHLRAAEEYRRMVAEVPTAEFADLALYNSALEYEQAKEYGLAIDSYTQLLNNFPESDHHLEALNNLAFDYRELSDNHNAAVTYEKLADLSTKDEEAQVALYNASVSFVQAEEWARAIDVNNKFVARFPESEDADELLFSNARYYLKLNDIKSANNIYGEFTKKFPTSPRVVEAFYLRGLYYKENELFDAAKSEFDKAIRTNTDLKKNKKEVNDFFAAEALFQLAEIKFHEFQQIKFKLPDENLAANKTKKKALLLELVDNYTKTAAYGTFRLYQATYRIGNCYEEFADTWATQEIPNLDESQQTVARKDINETAAELYDRAVETYKTGVTALVKFSESHRKSVSADSLQPKMTKLALRDTSLAAGEKWIQKCKDKISENLYKIAEIKLESARHLLAAAPPAGIQKLEELVYRNQLLVKAITPILKEAVDAHARNIAEGQELNLENQWIQLSKNNLVSSRNILPTEFHKLGEESLQGYQDLVRPYQTFIKEQDEAAFDLADQMSNFLELSKSFSLAAVRELKRNIENFRSMNLDAPEVIATEDNLMRYIYEYHLRADSLSVKADELRKSYEDLFKETKIGDYEDAFLAFDDNYFALKDISNELLEFGYAVSRELDLINEWSKKITFAAVRMHPEKYAKDLGLTIASRALTTSSNWLATTEYTAGWTEINFVDTLWVRARVEVSSPTFSSTEAKSIWLWFDNNHHTNLDSANTEGTSNHSDGQPRPHRVYFRRSFKVDGLPVLGMLRLAVDDSYNLFVNGKYIAKYEFDTTEESTTKVHDVSEFLTTGKNIIALEVLDSDRSHGSLEAVLEIKNMPDWYRVQETPNTPELGENQEF